ncbi:hypothetical protein [Klebsiella quasipneumoniae]|uniref:hypothetical protein n=1 Tax=Klebsiella quasipneumoniae TaxID=1463165 RepID=UPI003EC9C0EB
MSRDENIQAVFDLKAGYTLGLADIEILKEVAGWRWPQWTARKPVLVLPTNKPSSYCHGEKPLIWGKTEP